jgi:hypothetical protein
MHLPFPCFPDFFFSVSFQPKVDNWAQYLGWVVEAGLPDAVFSTLNKWIKNEDVVLFSLHALSTWLEKDVERAKLEIQALLNIHLVVLDAARRHGRNVILVSKALSIFVSLPDEVLSGKELTLSLGTSLADLLMSSHEHGTHVVWQLGAACLARVLSLVAHNLTEWQASDGLQKLMLRLVQTVQRNASHWEVVHILQLIASFRVVLLPSTPVVVASCAHVMLAHTAGGTECSDRRVCRPDFDKTPSWGTTLDACLSILIASCMLPEHDVKNVMDGVQAAARAMLNSYVSGRKLETQARACLFPGGTESMANSGVPRACMELILSHSEYRPLVMKAVKLLLLISFGTPTMTLDDVYKNGAGALALLDIISQRRSSGLGNAETNEAELDFQSSAAALLMMLTRERRYKMGILGRGYEQIWSLVQTPDSMTLGLSALCHLSDSSPDAQEWLRKRGTDKDLLQLFADPMDLGAFKVVFLIVEFFICFHLFDRWCWIFCRRCSLQS